MNCDYCGKDLQDTERSYPELRELVKSRDSNRALHIDEMSRISKMFFPNYPRLLVDICTDCEYEIAKDPNKFILKQRLLR